MKKKLILTLLLVVVSIFAFAQQRCNYNGVHFDTVANFYKTDFDSSANFIDTQFDSTADFGEAHFDSSANFRKARFTSAVNFTDAQFNSIAFFFDVKFNSTVDFEETKFHLRANFVEANFDSTANFIEAQFDSIANFMGASFNSNSYFLFTKLPVYLDLSYVYNIREEIDLTESIINKKYGICNINLINSNIDKIKFRYSRFKLFFPDYTEPEIKSNVYEKLLVKQNKEGFISSIEKLDKEYREFWYKEGGEYNKIWGYFLNWINKTWWGYGYDKELIIVNTIFLFLFFFVINTFLFKHLVNKVYVIEKLQQWRQTISGSKIKIFFIQIPYSLFYTALIFFGLKFDLDQLKYQNNLKGIGIFSLLYFFVVYIAGLICLGYLANFIITT